MDITTKYAIGDVTYVVVNEKETTPVTCAICSSTGKVTIGGTEFICPACGGRREATGQKVDVVHSFTIDRVVAMKCGGNCQVRYVGKLDNGKDFFIVESKVYATQAEANAAIGG